MNLLKKVCTDIDCVKCQEYVECLKQSSPTSKIEETDTGMIAHTHQAALEDFKQFVFESNDEYVFALLVLHSLF